MAAETEEPNARKIHAVWRYGECRCGARKWEKTAFCDGCYSELSPETKKALQGSTPPGAKFCRAYRVAIKEIDGDERN